MAKASKIKPEQATGQPKPDAQPLAGAAASTGAAETAPVTQPTTELAAAGTVGQATAGTDTGATSPPAVVNEDGSWVTTVWGPSKGRWRAKRFFGPEPVTLRRDQITDDEWKQIHSDPELTTETVFD